MYLGRELPVTPPLISLDLFGSRKQFGIVTSHAITHVPLDRIALHMSSKNMVRAVFVPTLSTIITLGVVSARLKVSQGRRAVILAMHSDLHTRAHAAHTRHERSVLHCKDEGTGGA